MAAQESCEIDTVQAWDGSAEAAQQVFNWTKRGREGRINVQDMGLLVLPTKLWELHALTEFDCSHNLLTELPKSLFELPCMQWLNAARCQLDAQALCDVADAMRSNSSILDFHLYDNPGSNDVNVARAFVIALRANSSLFHLSLSGMFKTETDPPEVGLELKAALSRNKRGEPAPEPYHPLVKSASKR